MLINNPVEDGLIRNATVSSQSSSKKEKCLRFSQSTRPGEDPDSAS